MNIEKMREEFEAWMIDGLIREMKKPESGHPSDADFSAFIRQSWFDRKGDSYMLTVPHYSWLAWQASRAAIEVELPIIDDKDWAITASECEAMRSGIRMAKHSINAVGIKVKPEPIKADPHICSGCGACGWTANCNQCIPF